MVEVARCGDGELGGGGGGGACARRLIRGVSFLMSAAAVSLGMRQYV